jgi:alpha 1,3-glucosidase
MNTGIKLLLDVYSLQDNTARIKLKELEPIKERYEIPLGDVLVQEPVPDRFVVWSC